MLQHGEESMQAVEEALQRYDLVPKTRQRLEDSHEAMYESLTSMKALLEDGGLVPEFYKMFEHSPRENLSEYYHHILRDWAWDEQRSQYFATHVNDENLKRIKKVWLKQKPEFILALGAGAGRLSWDIHVNFNPKLTIATDINPVLLASAIRLIKQQRPLTLPELYKYPQIGFPHAAKWKMKPANDPDAKRDSWIALGADVWNMPLKPRSVDCIVTSWLLDVAAGDVRDLIGVITYLLKPDGQWINTGPLLYSPPLPFDQKYSAEEIKQFASLAGFEIKNENVDEIAHMASPINARFHHEQVWSFAAIKKHAEENLPYPQKPTDDNWLTPGWLIIHHLPVPQLHFACPHEHDLVEKVFSLVDGKRSIQDISYSLQALMPEGIIAKEAVVALFAEALEFMGTA